MPLALWACSWSASLPVSPASAALPDDRNYELVSPPDFGGNSVLPVLDTNLPSMPQNWTATAFDGNAVVWHSIASPSDVPDSAGYVDFYRSVRGAAGWKSSFVAPPSATGGMYGASLVFASPSIDALLWITNNATMDPSDTDPVSITTPTAFADLYRGDPSGAFVHLNIGSLATPAPVEALGFVGASQDLSKVVFRTDRQLEPGAPANGGLYMRDGSTTRLISKDENGTPLPGSTSLSYSGTSEDASVIAFADIFGNLYVWSAQSGDTVKVAGSGAADTISADGRKVFFTSDQPLTAADTDTSTDLYQYDTVAKQLTLISAAGGQGNSDSCAVSLPSSSRCGVAPVIETSDGSKAYFLSPERLDPGHGVDGGSNLYLATGGEIRFVATLDPADRVTGGGVRDRHVRVTPDGSKLLFESGAARTSYDNAGHTEVYLYNSAAGTLSCASCRPDGAAPTGDSFLLNPGSNITTPYFTVPPARAANADEHGDQVYFTSYDPIVPGDVNGRADVYEYAVATGRPALISSGTSTNDSAYFGNGLDGRDVFFLTVDTLVPQDRNGDVYKLYDARTGGGFPSSSPPPPCQGAACRPDESAPAPASQATDRIVPRSRRSQTPVTRSRLVVSGARSVKGTNLRLTAKVSGPGRLHVAGRGVVSSSTRTSRAGSSHLTVRLSKASAAKLRRVHRLLVSASVRFTPSKGTARSVRVRLTFTAPSNRNAR